MKELLSINPSPRVSFYAYSVKSYFKCFTVLLTVTLTFTVVKAALLTEMLQIKLLKTSEQVIV